ncbi:hypothetical protein TIFTF001_012189 [Ficus carica]|uniref:Uncharacterized protein n=1 Tax=Ficus carica TaxID=3494 RepID=A0AA88D3H0_FICCA|nr:hypothetical protein TIFTF001_012189 [Ficus carica]
MLPLPPPRAGEPPAANDKIQRHRAKEASPTAIGEGEALLRLQPCCRCLRQEQASPQQPTTRSNDIVRRKRVPLRS